MGYSIANYSLHRRHWFEAHAIAQALQPPGEPVYEVLAPLFVKVVRSQLVIPSMAGEHVERPHDGRMCDGQDGAFFPSTGGQALIQGRQVGSFGPGGGMGHLRQACTQGAIALAGLPRPPRP